MLYILLVLCLPYAVFTDNLVQVQVVWRHGDRTPLIQYPTDPYKDYWSQWPMGELSTIGMSQHYHQGLKRKERYIDQLKFVSSSYKREEILVQSSSSPRCIQSAASNLAAFYLGSKNTHPDDQGWPSQWTPIPIHTLEEMQAHLLDPGHKCPRNEELMAIRTENKEFVEYGALHGPMVLKIGRDSGLGDLDFDGLAHFYDCVRIEKEFRNFTLPSWIAPELYAELAEVSDRTGDYMYGQADFGVGDDVELLKLRGGPLLTEILKNMNMAQNGTDSVKMHVYSAHDITVSALLRVLGAKSGLLGDKNPDYAAMLSFELWKGDSGYYVKMVYSANESTSFRTVTHLISGCGGGNTCPFSLVYGRSRPYLVEHPAELCDKVL